MPKLIPHIDKLVIAKMSLDMPAPAIAERVDVNLATVRVILDDPEIKDFVKGLRESRYEGFRAGEVRASAEYAYKLCFSIERDDSEERTNGPPDSSSTDDDGEGKKGPPDEEEAFDNAVTHV